MVITTKWHTRWANRLIPGIYMYVKAETNKTISNYAYSRNVLLLKNNETKAITAPKSCDMTQSNNMYNFSKTNNRAMTGMSLLGSEAPHLFNMYSQK